MSDFKNGNKGIKPVKENKEMYPYPVRGRGCVYHPAPQGNKERKSRVSLARLMTQNNTIHVVIRSWGAWSLLSFVCYRLVDSYSWLDAAG